ncbi:hypothetical protein BBJ28_00025153, partial [Nothophytophthora sp. Chile5]
MGSLLPYNDRATGEMTAPKFAQIYIVDADMRRRAERRRGIFADLDPSILFDLEQMMERYNPFAQDFLYFGKVLRRQREAGQQPVDIVFKLHANNRASPGTYNLPTTSEVAAVMIDDGNIGHHRDLLLYTRDHTPTRLFETHAIYDPLQYPLLFPCGEPGWTYTDTYANGAIVRNKREMPLREHVAYRLHPKHGDGSVLHEGGRLFQQYAVDQRAKCEQNNLRWIAANQKDIRADACMRLLNYVVQGKTHSVVTLSVHLDGQQLVQFETSENPERVMTRGQGTTLIRFFELCQGNDEAKDMLYQDIPKRFRWTDLSRDLAYKYRARQNKDEVVMFHTLKSLHDLLVASGKALHEFDLPQLTEFPDLVLQSLLENTLIRRELEGYDS